MVNVPTPKEASYLSTGVVARALGIDAAAVRSMISAGSLPQPQWITLGSTVERIYSLEWLLLAGEKVNSRRLSGLEYEISPDDSVRFALRFERTDWNLSEVTRKLVALEALWNLCAQTLSASDDVSPPSMNIRRLSAGSPLDLLAWASENWPGLAGAGGLVSLFIYVIKSPDKVAGAIPRFISSWRDGWADADDAAVRRVTSRANRERFEREAARHLEELSVRPSETALSGPGTRRLELENVDDDARSIETPSEPTEISEARSDVGIDPAGPTS